MDITEQETEAVNRKLKRLGIITTLYYKRLHIPTMTEETIPFETVLIGREAQYLLWSQIVKWNSLSPGQWQYYM